MPCEWVLTSNCPNNHAQTWKCHQTQPLTCRLCDREAKRAAEKQQKDFELQQKRDAERQAHDEKMAKIREKLDAQIQAQKDLELAKEREAALKQQEQDVKDMEERMWKRAEAEKKRKDAEERLRQEAEAEKKKKDEEERLRQEAEAKKTKDEEARKRAAEQAAASSSSIAAAVVDTVKSRLNTLMGTPPKPSSPENTEKKEEDKEEDKEEEKRKEEKEEEERKKKKKKESEAKSDWQRRKDIEGVANPHIDAIMEMIGLEPVKQQVLRIMDKVDVNIRQGTSLSKERFNVVFLGNPGTGIIRLLAPHGILTHDILQERPLWRGTMPSSWLSWMFSPVTSSWKLLEPSSETRESLAPRRWLRILSRPAEAVSLLTRHTSSPLNKISVAVKYWITCWRKWRTISESSCSFSLGTASRWKSSSSTTLDSRAAFLINFTSRTTKTKNCSSCLNNKSRRSGTSA